MSRYKEQRTEPYSAGQLFDIAADIEAYPSYVPSFVAARIISRDGDRLHVDNVLGVGPMRFRFITQAVLERPRRISIVSVDDTIGTLSISWSFDPVSDWVTTVALDINHRFDSALLTHLSGAFAGEIEHRILDAFEKRLKAIYGDPPPDQT